mgnify:CR=1 FL=1
MLVQTVFFSKWVFTHGNTHRYKYMENGLENKLLKDLVLELVFLIQRWKWVANDYFIKRIL